MAETELPLIEPPPKKKVMEEDKNMYLNNITHSGIIKKKESWQATRIFFVLMSVNEKYRLWKERKDEGRK